ncbi:hypothetical protein GCM10010329_37510 [Streptomyces spiroverticillatus]|uniref:Uncharacterized protein n=1 Tax=Streptomyces finlayi TaxID=67296 RepID=A0A919CAU8_9ACTN|nr:hypothetical protein GCM10010329_37510 [Streptomyces spiroverticillatus]GHC95159.1 hypothetical protein GCM10010334_34100 [Streptomyces finlayi]
MTVPDATVPDVVRMQHPPETLCTFCPEWAVLPGARQAHGGDYVVRGTRRGIPAPSAALCSTTSVTLCARCHPRTNSRKTMKSREPGRTPLRPIAVLLVSLRRAVSAHAAGCVR